MTIFSKRVNKPGLGGRRRSAAVSDLFQFNSSPREESARSRRKPETKPLPAVCSYRIAYSVTDPNMGITDRLAVDGHRRCYQL